MTTGQDSKVDQVLEMQNRISARLDQLGYSGNAEAKGNIIHHLAEVAVMARTLAQESVPTFLELPLDERDALGELIVGIQYDLVEMKEAIEDMEPELIKLMNFLNPD